jgi:hypothetical protein
MSVYIAKGIRLGFIDKSYPATQLAVQEKSLDDSKSQAATVIEVLFDISRADEIGFC